VSRTLVVCVLLVSGCAGSDKPAKDDASDAGGAGAMANGAAVHTGSGGAPAADAGKNGTSPEHGSGGAGGSGTGGGGAGSNATGDASVPPNPTLAKAGNPDGKCSKALPAEAHAADSSHPTNVVGTGTAASCAGSALTGAFAKGGVITFDCGDAPVTLTVTSTLELPTDHDTVIDGGNKITLDGGGKVRILSWNSPDWQNNDNTLTLQHLVLANGKASGTEMIPKRMEPCSQGYNDGEGGALYMRDGALRAIDVTFMNNQAAELGPDTGGGAVYMLGCKPAYIASCTFQNNKASNAGAVGSLFTTDFIYDSLFDGNQAVGRGANNNDASMCSEMNNGQNEVGSGGNGGAIYSDGVAMDVTICGTQVRNSTAGAFGAAVFFTSNDQSMKGTLSITDSLMFNNTPEDAGWEWKPGISTNADTPEPIASDIRR
jgi:hypothetical protein